jgi:hypothetical protein
MRLRLVKVSWMKRARNGEDGIRNVGNAYKVGNPIIVRLNDGRIVEGKIRAVIEGTDGLRLQVDYGHDETALIHETQVRKQ